MPIARPFGVGRRPPTCFHTCWTRSVVWCPWLPSNMWCFNLISTADHPSVATDAVLTASCLCFLNNILYIGIIIMQIIHIFYLALFSDLHKLTALRLNRLFHTLYMCVSACVKTKQKTLTYLPTYVCVCVCRFTVRHPWKLVRGTAQPIQDGSRNVPASPTPGVQAVRGVQRQVLGVPLRG